MSEQPRWMPSDDALEVAASHISPIHDDDRSCGFAEVPNFKPLRALIATTVEKALAEQREKYNCPICYGTPPASGVQCACGGTNDVRDALDYCQREWGRLVAEERFSEARHKRELIQAGIDELNGPGGVCRCGIFTCNNCRRIAELEAKLAALDSGAK